MKMKIIIPVSIFVALLISFGLFTASNNEQVTDLVRTGFGPEDGTGIDGSDNTTDDGIVDDDEPSGPQDDEIDDLPDNEPSDPQDDEIDDLPDNDPPKYPDNTTDEPSENDTGEDLIDDVIDDKPGNGSEEDPVIEPDPDSPYMYPGEIVVEGIGTFDFLPWEVDTIREDIFNGGHFSLFDILVHLDNEKEIDLEYHYADALDTYVIDSINGIEDWWYWAYYSGGWREDNAWRMDMYPYKDNTTVHVHEEETSVIQKIEITFAEEVRRKEENDGRIIIPKVIIRGHSFEETFDDVPVFAHDLRSDSLQPGVITAIDVIMSLGDLGMLTYELKWYETISNADPVKSYWVEGINDDLAYGSCGFVYETGSEDTNYRNHIHIPSDQRVLVSPDYEEWFWICL